ncbi:MAG: DUF3343 domain-containing protein [Eubacteriales bacterium]|nr:DUF3343 domain-containing protein [Eubacteriales bacterium]
MRQRILRTIMTFPTTTDAMAAERLFQKAGLEGRLIPVPGFIRAGCGLAWSAPAGMGQKLCEAAREHGTAYEECQEALL